MADQPVTKEKLINADIDVENLGKAVNELGVVNPRYGDTYKTLPQIASEYEQNGATRGFNTLAEFNAVKSTIPAYTVVTISEAGANQGLNVWSGTALTKSAYDPLTQAAADAATKANTAKSEAISAAATDATTKANAAEANAKTYADQKTASKVEGVLGKNLFDKSKVTIGKGLGDTGGEITAATRSVSDFIPASPNTAYSFTSTNKVCFYDANKVFVQLSFGALANVISHANATFMRVDAVTAQLDTVQVEKSTYKTNYEDFGYYLKPNSVEESTLKGGSVSSEKLQVDSVEGRHIKNAVWLNMHDASKLRKGFTISQTNGITETVNTSYDVSEYIPCQPNTEYSVVGNSGMFFYRKDGSFLSFMSSTSPFTTPTNCYQVRIQISSLVSDRLQMNKGNILSPKQEHKYFPSDMYIPEKTKPELDAITARKYSFSDAWVAWRNGEKFPVCFLGDSTTNGNGTTSVPARKSAEGGGYDFTEDYVAPNAYPKVMQDLIREATGNTQMRAYNAGFSGQRMEWAAANIDQILGHAYADAMMVGLSHGINDRTANPKLFATNFYRDNEIAIKWCLANGKQPFFITTQPTTMPNFTGSASTSDIEEVGNEIKRNLASKYNLEIVDVTNFGQQFMQYSTKPLLNNIMEAGSNVIHFGDGGHKFTAELMFASFCKRCIWTTEGEQLGYATQLMKSEINFDQLKQINPFKQGFKVELNTTQADATDTLLQDFYVFNAGRKQFNLTAYYANAPVGQYVQVNGVQTTITQQGQSLGALDLGLHKIKAYSGATTQLDWLGFKLKPGLD